jgi:hypothetical protein
MTEGTTALILLLVIVTITGVCVYLDSIADKEKDDEVE